MENNNLYDITKANHTLYAYPYMVNANYFYTPYFPFTQNVYMQGHQVLKTPAVNVNVSLFSCKETYLEREYNSSFYLSENQSESPKQIFPVAVRYADLEQNIYIVERPPFRVPIDYYKSKDKNAKIPAYLEGRSMWIPWTLFTVCLNGDVDSISAKIYFNDKSLSSFDDTIVKVYTPNVFDDGRICFGNSSWTFGQRVISKEIEYNISSVYNYLFNDYFTQWNPDIGLRNHQYLFNWMVTNKIFERIKLSKEKRKPKGFDEIFYWNKPKTSWPYALYALSHLSFEETMKYISDYREFYNSSLSSNSISSYSNKSVLSVKQLISNFYESGSVVTSFNPNHVDYNIVNSWNWDRFFKSTFNSSPELKAFYRFEISDIPESFQKPENELSNFATVFANSNIINIAYSYFFAQIQQAISNIKQKHGIEQGSLFNLDTIMGFGPHDHSAYRYELFMEIQTIASSSPIVLSYNDLVKDTNVYTS
jgi:hypothetical protein